MKFDLSTDAIYHIAMALSSSAETVLFIEDRERDYFINISNLFIAIHKSIESEDYDNLKTVTVPSIEWDK